MLLHCPPNARLRVAREEAWEGKAREASGSCSPTRGGETVPQILGAVSSGEEWFWTGQMRTRPDPRLDGSIGGEVAN